MYPILYGVVALTLTDFVIYVVIALVAMLFSWTS